MFKVSRSAKCCLPPRTVLAPRLSRFVGWSEQGETGSESCLLRPVEVRRVEASNTSVVSSLSRNDPHLFASRRDRSVKSVLSGTFKNLKRAARVSRVQRLRERLAIVACSVVSNVEVGDRVRSDGLEFALVSLRHLRPR